MCHQNGEHWTPLCRAFVHFKVVLLVEANTSRSCLNGDSEEGSCLRLMEKVKNTSPSDAG